MTGVEFEVVAPGYERVAELARAFAADDPGWTFQLAIRDADGIAVQGGAGSAPFDLHLQASVTKGITGIALGTLVERGLLDLEAPVASVWPEFAAAGKERITIASALSHRAGLVGFTAPMGLGALEDGTAAEDLAAQRPRWTPGAAHGYHSFTIGVLADELCRRVAGVRVWQLLETIKGDAPLLEAWMRLPADQYHRLVSIEVEERDAIEPTGSLADDAHATLNALGAGNRWLNSRELLAAASPAVSAVATAIGIADLYARAIGILGSTPLLSAGTLAEFAQVRSVGEDLVLGGLTRYGVLFQKSRVGLDFGTSDAIGHDGAGGGLGFADPRTGVAFGYTSRRAIQPGGADWRALAIAREIRTIRMGSARARSLPGAARRQPEERR